tara:strand:+ start:248 stop:604 length:357 start_codon:yes stop_codon:yes gene_type:complete
MKKEAQAMEKKVEATAWCDLDSNGIYQYRLQVNNVGGRSVKNVAATCADWRNAGFGWNPETEYKILIFSRGFKTQKEWLKWAKQFPYKLVELNSKGKPKPIKLGVDFREKSGRKRKRK